MREIACSHNLQAFDFGVAGYFFDFHLLTSCSTKSAMNMQVSDYSNWRALREFLAFIAIARISLAKLKNLSRFDYLRV